MRILINNCGALFVISKLPAPARRRTNVSRNSRPSLVPWKRSILFIRWICLHYLISTLFSHCLRDIPANDEINFFWVVYFAISSGIFRGSIICDKPNHGFVSDSSLLLSRKPFNLRSFVAEQIACTYYTTPNYRFEFSFLYRRSHFQIVSPMSYVSEKEQYGNRETQLLYLLRN